MTAHGQPDQPRSARYVLKDYVSVSSYYVWVFFPAGRWTETFTGAWRITIKWIPFLWIKLMYIKICFKSGHFYVLNKWNHHLFKADRIFSGNGTILFIWVSIFISEDCYSECCSTACFYSTCQQLIVEYFLIGSCSTPQRILYCIVWTGFCSCNSWRSCFGLQWCFNLKLEPEDAWEKRPDSLPAQVPWSSRALLSCGVVLFLL